MAALDCTQSAMSRPGRYKRHSRGDRLMSIDRRGPVGLGTRHEFRAGIEVVVGIEDDLRGVSRERLDAASGVPSGPARIDSAGAVREARAPLVRAPSDAGGAHVNT
jgi:hypothetical protein